MCSREWYDKFDNADALILDSYDEYAASVLRFGGDHKMVGYDKLLTQLTSILVVKYVIVDYYKALGKALRIELPSYCFFDVATNFLVRSKSLRRVGHFLQRSRNVAALLAELWASVFDGPLDWPNTAAVASKLRTIFMNVKKQYAHNNFIFASPTEANCP